MDYYKILGLDSKSATRDDVSNAFRELSVKYHPMMNKDSLAKSHIEFNKVCEAYEVLSNPKFKSEYDQHGENGLKNGTTRKKNGKVVGSYSFSGNSLDIFQGFFGNANPFTDKVQAQKSKDGKPDPDAPKDIEIVLGCTIYEFYNGSIKQIKFSRQKLEPDGRSMINVEEEMTVEVKKGYDTDTVLSFASKGHEAYAAKHSSLNIKFQLEASDVNFQRKGDDLVYTHVLTLEDALICKPIQVRTLDGRYINFSMDNMITPQSVHKIVGEGMPRKENNSEKGDLHIKFDIQFPKMLKSEYKQQIIDLLA